ncbi:MAG: hypothetical protein U9R44_05120 [Candidatus Omnitrophota bacterium]|nr:hypothetical protein [Candidatus Omnitrophota bacterium]
MFKKILFSLIFIALALLFIELAGHIFYRSVKGVWVWEVPKQHDIFNIRAFTELVDDGRIVTNSKNYNCVVSRNRVYLREIKEGEKGSWSVKTDSNGFRIGKNSYSTEKNNIVFLGDSVPFGWGIEGDQSVPSRFYELAMKDSPVRSGIINAAIPSYSLYQAGERYKYEIDGKFPVKYVILQIYDPSLQFVMWGRKWDRKMCWSSKDTLISFEDIVREQVGKRNFLLELIREHSFIYHAIYCLRLRLKKTEDMPLRLDLEDREAFEFFEKENISVLEDLHALIEKEDAVLIILPVNPERPLSSYAPGAFNNLGEKQKKLLVSIDFLNDILRKFASTHADVYYFDIITRFEKMGRKGLFIDGCHLSEEGAQKQAEFILEQMKANGLV